MSAPPATAASTPTVPYSDERSSGLLTLCDAAGHELKRGSVATQPFTHLVVGSTAAPTGYDTGQGTASVYGYQPRQGLAAGQWSGELLTGASRFANAKHPAAVALPEDLSLANLVADFPPSWAGFVQLRLVLGAPGLPLSTDHYDTADLKVSGGSWTLVRGGGGRCQGVRAVAVAQLLGVQATGSPSSAAGKLPRGIATRAPASAPHATPDLAPAGNSSALGHSPSHLVVAVVLSVLLLLGFGGLLARRRKHVLS